MGGSSSKKKTFHVNSLEHETPPAEKKTEVKSSVVYEEDIDTKNSHEEMADHSGDDSPAMGTVEEAIGTNAAI